MTLKTITEDGVSRVRANVLLSDGTQFYLELPIAHDLNDNAAHEAVITEHVEFINNEWDEDENPIPLSSHGVTITSITETE
jgi:hypothetical protein